MKNQIHLTFDVDWAPDFVLEDLEQLLSTTSAPVTLFSTHKSPVITRLYRRPNTEMAIHPNFMKTEDEGSRLKEVMSLFPAAKGVRTHGFFFHCGLLELYHRTGMEYLSNDLLFLQPALQPFYDWTGLPRIPIFWEDKAHLLHSEVSFELSALPMSKEGLKVFSFHPAHIYLNSRNLLDYVQKRSYLKDPAQALRLREEGPGIRALFLELLEKMKGEDSSTLLDLTKSFKRNSPYVGTPRPPVSCDA